MKVNSNAVKLRRIQRLVNINIAKAYRAISHEALCDLPCNTPITIELGKIASLYYTKRYTEEPSTLDTPCNYRDLPHPTDTIKIKGKDESTDYIYTSPLLLDGCTLWSTVTAGVAYTVRLTPGGTFIREATRTQRAG